MAARTYKNLYGKEVMVEEIDRGSATEEETQRLVALEYDIRIYATWARMCVSKFVEHEGKRQLEISVWGDDEKPYRTLYYEEIPEVRAVIYDLSSNTQGETNAEASGQDGQSTDEAGA